MRKRNEPRPVAGGYADREVTQPPNWHGLVAWDLLLNNLATGTFLVAALGELATPSLVGPARLAYPLAVVFLTADLVCLVLDLGDPLRFHHMLRVVKPRSPMSVGTWCLTVFSAPLTAIVALDLAAWLGWISPSRPIHLVLVVAGLAPALGSSMYKGVLFSTSSQPGWKAARWLGGYLVNSAFVMGCGVLLTVAGLMGDVESTARLLPAFRLLLLLNLVPLAILVVELRSELARLANERAFFRAVAWTTGLGVVGPLALSWAPGRPGSLVVTLGLLLAGNFLLRDRLVKLPHQAHH